MQRSAFRPDASQVVASASIVPDPEAESLQRYDDLILEIRALRAAIEPRTREVRRIFDACRAQTEQVRKLKGELDLIAAANGCARDEIAKLAAGGIGRCDIDIPPADQSEAADVFAACEDPRHDLARRHFTKLSAALKSIDRHVSRMNAIFRDIEALQRFAPAYASKRRHGEVPCKGPPLGAAGEMFEDDALFE